VDENAGRPEEEEKEVEVEKEEEGGEEGEEEGMAMAMSSSRRCGQVEARRARDRMSNWRGVGVCKASACDSEGESEGKRARHRRERLASLGRPAKAAQISASSGTCKTPESRSARRAGRRRRRLLTAVMLSSTSRWKRWSVLAQRLRMVCRASPSTLGCGALTFLEVTTRATLLLGLTPSMRERSLVELMSWRNTEMEEYGREGWSSSSRCVRCANRPPREETCSV
jgi:hypothetical protein